MTEQGLTLERLKEAIAKVTPAEGIPPPVRFIESIHCAETKRWQVRFPRTKRKRIQKKWRKDARNWKTEVVPWRHCIQTPFGLMGHPRTIECLKKVIQEKDQCPMGGFL